MSLDQAVNALVNGLLLGALYSGLSLGLSLILGILRIINIAHSAILVFAALCYWELVEVLSMDPLLAMLPVVAAFYIVGLGLHRGLDWRLARESDSTSVLAYFGVLVAVQSVAIVIWSTDTRTLNSGYLSAVWRVGFVSLPAAQVVTAGITVALFVGLDIFLVRSTIGSAILGIGQSRQVSALVGIDVPRLARHVFAGGIALAAFGGIVLALNLPFTPQGNVQWLAWTFLVVLLGGVGSIRATFLAGLIVGLVESFAGATLPAQFTYIILYSLLALALVVRREGVLGSPTRVV